MTYDYKGYTITDNQVMMDLDAITILMNSSYWAEKRPKKIIATSMANSICFGVFKGDMQVGFARVVSDLSTMYWLCDVLIDEKHKGYGLGKQLVEQIVSDDKFEKLLGILATQDAHGLYEKYGFQKDDGRFMRRPRGE